MRYSICIQVLLFLGYEFTAVGQSYIMDFDQNFPSFNSSYKLASTCCEEDAYWIGKNMNDGCGTCNPTNTFPDESGDGNFLTANAGSSQVNLFDISFPSWILKPGNYHLSVRSRHRFYAPIVNNMMAIQVGSQFLAMISIPFDNTAWTTTATNFNVTTTGEFKLANIQNGNWQANDFAMDNIVISPILDEPCKISLHQTCLPSGMVEILALDGQQTAVDPKKRENKFSWLILDPNQNGEYSIYNENPILVPDNTTFKLNYKQYSWKKGLPKTYEFADVCEQKMQDKAQNDCIGFCDNFEFLLSSCHDDLAVKNGLQFPKDLCESVCARNCFFTVVIFDKQGKLINPSEYRINWSNGASTAFVRLMYPYYNNLTVEVVKGNCKWKGIYKTNCDEYHTLGSDRGGLYKNQQLKFFNSPYNGNLETDFRNLHSNEIIHTLNYSIIKSPKVCDSK